MKQLLVLVFCLLYFATVAVVMDTNLCMQNITIRADALSDKLDAILAVRKVKSLLAEYGYPQANFETVINFDIDPIGKFDNNDQLGYTIHMNRYVYVRSYETLQKMDGTFYFTDDLYKYHAFNRSIILHELIHSFLRSKDVSETGLAEFLAYSIGISYLPPKLLTKVLATAETLKVVPFPNVDVMSTITFKLSDYFCLKAYLLWSGYSDYERKDVFRKIVDEM